MTEGQVIAITGGAAGMGAAAAALAVSQGARVIAIDRDPVGLDRVVAAIRDAGGDGLSVVADVTSEDELALAVEQAIGTYGRVDSLLTFAGVANFAPAASTDGDVWGRQLDINLTGTFRTCQAFGRAMIAAGSGAIVNVASTAGVFGVPGMAAYSAAKHGVVGLTRALAVEWARFGVRVNCICPGATLTPMLLATTEEFRSTRSRRIPMGRFGEPVEQARAALFLASPAASYITGAVLPVDGGIAAMAPGTAESALWPEG